MIHKIVTSKTKDGNSLYGVIYKDDPKKEVRFLTKDEINAAENGKELLSSFINTRNEKKKIRSIEHIYGFVMPPDCEWLYTVKFKGSDKIDIVGRKELKKYNIDALIQFYESHIDFLHDSMETAIQKQNRSKSKPKHHNQTSSTSSHKHEHQASSPQAHPK